MNGRKAIGLIILALCVGLCGCQSNSKGNTSLDEVTERLTLEDEKIAVFSKGSPEGFWARNDRGNGGMFHCAFGSSNAVINENTLKLILDKQAGGYVGAEYRTHQKYSYGFYSVRMKVAKCSGVISSFFLYTGRPWDEIDIEFLGNDTTKVQFNYFTNGQGNHEYIYNLGFDASEDFHEYAFDWQPDAITWYVDGKPVYRAEVSIPSHAGHIMMNLWNVTPDKAYWAGKFEESKLPVSAEYEWIGFSSAGGALK